MRINTPAGLRTLTGSTIVMAAIAAVSFAGEATSADSRQNKSGAELFGHGKLERVFARYQRDLLAGRIGTAGPVAVHPVKGSVDYGTHINQFGVQRSSHVHGGQDVFAPTGTPLVAVRDGIVVATGSDGGRGNYVEIYSPRAKRTYSYFHMVAPASVRAGQRVKAGQRVGAVGCTGSCQGAHLHFEVHAGRGASGEAVDPLPLLRRWRRA